jgi:glycosyltransferase involved in cell wall biosynthesis
MGGVKISVCIPVYNGEEFIREAIDSVLAQDYTDFELVIVDNQSNDSSISIIESYNDRRIKLFRNDSNIGMVPNWNRALEHAQGTYIKILPADDLLMPGCLKAQVEILEKDTNKEISLVCGRRNIIDHTGKVLFTRGFTNRSIRMGGTDAVNKVIRSGGNSIGEGGAVMFRREIIQKTGNFTDAIFYLLDLDLWFRILLHGDLFALPQVVSGFRVSGSSASVKVVKKQKEDYFNFIKKIYNSEQFKLSWINYRTGLFFTFALTEAKKLIYRFVVKG